jgi:hypothetical protein
MPLYNFRCEENHIFEISQSMGAYNGEYKCPLHNKIATRTYEGQRAPAALNASSACGYHTTESDYIQLGKKFTSAKEQDAYAASLGLVAISKEEHERESYVTRGKDRMAEWETPADVRQRNEDAEAIKQETYALIKQNGGVHLNHDPSKVYQLNEKNQLVREENGQTKILTVTPVKE